MYIILLKEINKITAWPQNHSCYSVGSSWRFTSLMVADVRMLYTITSHLHCSVESSLNGLIFMNVVWHHIFDEVCLLLLTPLFTFTFWKNYNLAQWFMHGQVYGSNISSKCGSLCSVMYVLLLLLLLLLLCCGCACIVQLSWFSGIGPVIFYDFNKHRKVSKNFCKDSNYQIWQNSVRWESLWYKRTDRQTSQS
jgi:hypothetical protein